MLRGMAMVPRDVGAELTQRCHARATPAGQRSAKCQNSPPPRLAAGRAGAAARVAIAIA